MSDMPSVLLVDDEKYVLNALRIVLEPEGYEVATAPGGEEALALLHEQEFNVMVSDIRMAPMNGMELLRKAHDLSPSMSVIMLTGYGTPATATEALKYDVFDYLIKPVTAEALLSTVKHALAQNLSTQEGQSSSSPDAATRTNTSLKAFLRSKESTYSDNVPKLL